MNFLEIILLLIIAGICGGIAQSLVGYSSGGCILSIVVGFIGALLGTWIGREMGLPEFLVIEIGDTSFPVIWSIIGAVVFVGIISLLTPKRKI